jgi:hypothetical protein
MRMRRVTVLATAACALAALVGAGSAQARLDTTFGTAGVATVNPPFPPGWQNERIETIATGQEGETYVVVHQRDSCAAVYPCPEGDFLFRYLASGALEPAFAGGRGFEVPTESTSTSEYRRGQALVAVGSDALPVIGRTVLSERERPGSGAIVVRRLLADGTLDTGYGAGGAVRLPCPCERENTQLLAGPQASTFVVATSQTRKKAQGKKSGSTASATLIKLDAAGHRAKGYGSRGSVTAQMPGEGEIEYDAITQAGATYFGGRGLTQATHTGYISRISAKGRLDTAFGAKATKALQRLNGIKGNEVRVTAAVIGRGGPVELFGSAGSIGGFELRLNQNGSLRRGWAEKGLSLLPYPISAAVQGREGSTMALTGDEAAAPHLVRITSKGKLDKAFGQTGQILPGATNESGYSLFPAGLGRVGVSDIGLNECRQVCEPAAKLYRFLEGS